KGEQRMDVILHTTDHERWTIPLPKDSHLIREQPIAMVLGNPGLAVLRAVHEMNQVFHEGLRHRRGLPLFRPFRAGSWVAGCSQGVALGCTVSPLRGTGLPDVEDSQGVALGCIVSPLRGTGLPDVEDSQGVALGCIVSPLRGTGLPDVEDSQGVALGCIVSPL